jgi:hypothetical protein
VLLELPVSEQPDLQVLSELRALPELPVQYQQLQDHEALSDQRDLQVLKVLLHKYPDLKVTEDLQVLLVHKVILVHEVLLDLSVQQDLRVKMAYKAHQLNLKAVSQQKLNSQQQVTKQMMLGLLMPMETFTSGAVAFGQVLDKSLVLKDLLDQQVQTHK